MGQVICAAADGHLVCVGGTYGGKRCVCHIRQGSTAEGRGKECTDNRKCVGCGHGGDNADRQDGRTGLV